MSSRINLNNRQVQRLAPLHKIILAATSVGLIALCVFYISGLNTIPQSVKAGNGNAVYPNLTFHDPVLISGEAGQVNAIYNFAEVDAGIDAHVEILDLYNGARVDDMDHFTAGYYKAWQPFVASAANTISWIDWRITFKKAGTNEDTVLTQLAATAVDVDGDGAYLKEIVEADHVKGYSMLPGTKISVVFNRDSCQAMSTVDNVANIDTTRTDAMFMMVFYNVSSIDYRTGANSTYGAEEVRQTCIYFKYFDVMPTPLPVELISFQGNAIDNNKILLKWCTASETNNDFFSVERSANGEQFSEIGRVDGAGNSSVMRNYSLIDSKPLQGVGYYRLKQTDHDGTSATSKTIHVELNEKISRESKLKVTPNPFGNYFAATFELKEKRAVQIDVVSLNGSLISSEAIFGEEGINTYNFIAPSTMKPGIYIIKIRDTEKVIATARMSKL
ncbi:MAG: T9SS type A sorting domain-containing protein [Bacteroidota bacterium]